MSTQDNLKFMQWNCNGFFNKKNEIDMLINTHLPKVICIQESHLSLDVEFEKYKNFVPYRKDFINPEKACGGVLILCHESVYSEHLPIVSNLQVVAAKIKINSTANFLTVCNIYLPDNKFQKSDIQDILDQLNHPYILCGDFNAHNQLWGSSLDSHSGKVISDVYMDNENLILLNNNSPTHFCMRNGTWSNIDLSFISASLYAKSNWTVYEDLCSSDHFPIFTEIEDIGDNKDFEEILRWNFKKADWCKFNNALNFPDIEEPRTLEDINKLNDKITNAILDASKASIPQTKIVKTFHPVPWWTEAIHDTLRARNRAFRHYKKSNNIKDLILFRKRRAEARLLIKKEKLKVWIRYVDLIKISHAMPKSKLFYDHLQRLNKKKKIFYCLFH